MLQHKMTSRVCSPVQLNTESFERESLERESVERKSVDGESVDGESVDGESVDSLLSERRECKPLLIFRIFMQNGGIVFRFRREDDFFGNDWFCDDIYLQIKVFEIVMKNRGHLVEELFLESEVREHIDSLLRLPEKTEPAEFVMPPFQNLLEFMEDGGIMWAFHLLTCSWFTRSLDLQIKVFRLVMQKRGHLLDSDFANSRAFEKKIDSILLPERYENLLQFMENGGIQNAFDLFTCPWFTDSEDLQRKVFRLVMKNLGHLLNTDFEHFDDFEKHINSLLLLQPIEAEHVKVTLSYFENLCRFMENGRIRAGDYLLTCPFFTNSPILQEKIFRLVMNNRGEFLNTVSADFEKHIDGLLSDLLRNTSMVFFQIY